MAQMAADTMSQPYPRRICREPVTSIQSRSADLSSGAWLPWSWTSVTPLVFRPRDYAGIAVLRLLPQAMEQDLWEACEVLTKGLQQASIRGRLWIAQQERIREY